MKTFIVADASPLIGLGRIGQLGLLQRLYKEIVIPPGVQAEIQPQSPRPGAQAVRQAIRQGWIKTKRPADAAYVETLAKVLGRGEAEAIVLAREIGPRFILIDDRQGRVVAQHLGLAVVGTGAVLVAAKRRALIGSVEPILDALSAAGYRFSQPLRDRICTLARKAKDST